MVPCHEIIIMRLQIMKSFSFPLLSGLEVTKYPSDEVVSLKNDGRPLIIFYTVCGDRDHLQKFRLKLTVSQENIGGGDITLKRNTPLVYDSVAENRGISASLWNMISPDYEMCIEVPVRVWPDHPKVQDASVELKLGIKKGGRFPTVYRGGKFRLRILEETTPAATTITTPAATTITTPQPATTTVVTEATTEENMSSTASSEDLEDGDYILHLIKGEKETLNCRCYC
jgi:hypothetical protein